jgi:hypothetical protein
MKLFNLFLLFAFVFSFVFSNAKQAPEKVEPQTEQTSSFSENEAFDFSFDPFEISEFVFILKKQKAESKEQNLYVLSRFYETKLPKKSDRIRYKSTNI